MSVVKSIAKYYNRKERHINKQMLKHLFDYEDYLLEKYPSSYDWELEEEKFLRRFYQHNAKPKNKKYYRKTRKEEDSHEKAI